VLKALLKGWPGALLALLIDFQSRVSSSVVQNNLEEAKVGSNVD